MKKFVLLVIAGGIGVALAIAGAVGARSQATRIQVTATLTASEETPTPKGDVGAARGTFTATLTKSDTGAVMAWRLEFNNLTGAAVAAHIHIADRGKAGPVSVPLCAPCSSGASGSANVTNVVLEAIQNDRAYANVHTPTNPAGEIRDQVSTVASVKTTLRASQEVPKPRGKVGRAKGTFTATVTKQGTSGVVEWRLTFSRLTGPAVAAHIHSGKRGKSGTVIVPLCAPCKNGVRGRATVDASVLNALEAGRAYVNIHTKRNPLGEIRGQIAAVPLTIS